MAISAAPQPQHSWLARMWHAMFGSPVQKAVDAEIERGKTERRKHANTMMMQAKPKNPPITRAG